MTYKTLNDFDFDNKTVFVRADLNVPTQDGKITDTTRIDRFIPTLKEIIQKGGKVVIASHFGRPKGQVKPEFSTAFLAPAIEKASGLKVEFVPFMVGNERDEKIKAMQKGDVLLLENLRFDAGEEKNDRIYAEGLASAIDIYINDAFSCAHRAHASTEGMAALLPHGAGRLMEEELKALDKALGNPVRPAAALVAGSKVSTKLELLGNLVKKVDYLLIGGGMAHTFLAAQGIQIGKGSLVEPDFIETAKNILNNAGSCKIILPVDLRWANEFAANQEPHITAIEEIPIGKELLDIGPKTVDLFIQTIQKCKTLIWNGPVGAFELKPFDESTTKIALAVADMVKNGALVAVAGGGDTVSALKNAGVEDKLSYVSSAGGAFLEWMEGKTLPGVAVLEK